jgi:hypothetical protein
MLRCLLAFSRSALAAAMDASNIFVASLDRSCSLVVLLKAGRKSFV